MRARLFILITIPILLGAGCLGAPLAGDSNSMEKFLAEEKLSNTAEPQDAQFFIAVNWAGGMGSMPLLDSANGEPKQFNGRVIYFDPAYKSAVDEKLPDCYQGAPRVLVSANIALIEESDSNDSIPDAPIQTFYTAKVNRLNSITVSAEACE